MSNKIKHITFITPGFAKNETDTTCIPTIQDYFLALKQANPDLLISIITLQYPAKKTSYTWNGITIYPCFGGEGKLGSIKKWGKGIKTIRSIHKKKPIDVLHAFWLSESALIGWILKKLLKIPLTVTLMGQDALLSNKYQWLKNRSIDNLTAISAIQAKTFNANSAHKINQIIPWGVNIPNHAPVERTIDVLGVGNLIELKNYKTFIEVIHLLKNEFTTIKCRIIGNGAQFESLKNQIHKLGLTENIELTGELERSEVLASMQQAKVFLHPSIYEGQGYVFYEALHSGCSIVSFYVGAAQQSPQWTVCATKKEMTEATRSYMNSPLMERIDHPPTTKETVHQYEKLYIKLLEDCIND